MEFEPHDQYLQRLKKLSEIVEKGHVAYPTRFAWTHTAAEILEKYGSKTAEELAAQPVEVRVAGRLVQMRGHGKAGFAHLLNRGSRLQIYVKLDVVGERAYELYRLLDLGDSIGVAGHLFRTKTNELTIWVERIELLSKALLPLPEKWHGLSDVESRFRQRYLDLISNHRVRETFEKRAAVLREIRRWRLLKGLAQRPLETGQSDKRIVRQAEKRRAEHADERDRVLRIIEKRAEIDEVENLLLGEECAAAVIAKQGRAHR